MEPTQHMADFNETHTPSEDHQDPMEEADEYSDGKNTSP